MEKLHLLNCIQHLKKGHQENPTFWDMKKLKTSGSAPKIMGFCLTWFRGFFYLKIGHFKKTCKN